MQTAQEYRVSTCTLADLEHSLNELHEAGYDIVKRERIATDSDIIFVLTGKLNRDRWSNPDQLDLIQKNERR